MDLVTALALDLDPSAPDVISFVGGGGKTSTLFRLADEIAARHARVIVTTTTRLSAHEIAGTQAIVEVTNGQPSLDGIAQALDVHRRCMVVGLEIDNCTGRKRTGLAPDQVDYLVGHARQLSVSAVLVEADGSRMLPVKAPAEYEPVVPGSTTLLIPVAGLDAIGRRIDEETVHRPLNMLRILGMPPQQEPIRLSPNMLAKLLVHRAGGAKNLPSDARLLPLLNKAEQVVRFVAGRLTARHLVHVGAASLIGATAAQGDEPPVRERWAPLAAVVMAAGKSYRMGFPKQLCVVDGEPMVSRAVRVALESGVNSVHVVTGANASKVMEVLEPLMDSSHAALHVVHNSHWAAGQAASMHAGLNALPAHTGGVLFLPVDQPFLEPVYLRQMLSLWRKGAQIVAPRVDDTVRGAPALFDRRFWRELLLIRGDVGGRSLLHRHRDEVVAVPMPEAILRDIDEPADLGHLHGIAEQT